MKKMNVAFYGVVIALAIYYIYGSLSFGLWQGYGPGPGLLPVILGIAFLLLGVIQLFSKEALRSTVKDIFLTKQEGLRIAGLILLSFITVILMNSLGFLIVTVLLSFVVLRFFEDYSTKKSIITSLLLPFCLWIMFNVAFKLDLPDGLLSFIL